ncbi:MAG TPA: DVU3141 family protein [Polyangiaceae bacterium]|jgi:hypothetical protein
MWFSRRSVPKVWTLPYWFAGVLIVACGGAKVVPTAQEAKDAADTGTRLEAQTPLEQSVLAELPRMPADRPRSFGGVAVSAGAPYHAASGRPCRKVTLAAQAGEVAERVACAEAGSWFFVPDVFAPAPQAGPR